MRGAKASFGESIPSLSRGYRTRTRKPGRQNGNDSRAILIPLLYLSQRGTHHP